MTKYTVYGRYQNHNPDSQKAPARITMKIGTVQKQLDKGDEDKYLTNQAKATINIQVTNASKSAKAVLTLDGNNTMITTLEGGEFACDIDQQIGNEYIVTVSFKRFIL